MEWTDDIRKLLKDSIRKSIGALAAPEYIQFVDSMPKTQSGKIIRRMLRKIASNVYDDIGDTTALAKPEVIDEIIYGHKNVLEGKPETAKRSDMPESEETAEEK